MRIPTRLVIVLAAGGAALALPATALAHDAPKDDPWVMADWMLWSFVLFAGLAFLLFLITWKAGFYRNVEQAKYPLLEIDEPDYYTPDWAREDAEEEAET